METVLKKINNQNTTLLPETKNKQLKKSDSFFPAHIGKYVKYVYISFIHFPLPQAFTRKSQRPCSAEEYEWAVVL